MTDMFAAQVEAALEAHVQPYRVRRRLTNALYGVIFECELVNGRPGSSVAAKCVSLHQADAARKQQKARKMDDPWQERRVVSQLIGNGGHRHVLQCYDEFVHDNMMVFVMEYCPGGDLYEYMSAMPNGTLPEPQALRFMRQVVSGVHFLHQNGIAHRDLSLENILLRNGVCKIADFGLSIPAHQTSSEVAGKEYYMAPEVVAEKNYDPCLADVWSMGIMLFILLTGSPLLPLASASQRGFAALSLHGIVPVLAAWGVQSQFSAEIVDLLSRMLQVEPTHRISVSEILNHPVMQA
ncbi:hypothetical protein Poli38472_011730 [Pythium oligandrum]|uniref:Protein kinase domain-containing protein n=1 Tax=Pythium oligandrum TaxID=41045 RepID=A0A8K1FFY5_PYTOL|nr:hypothetical protein Poli38472_011730 [Pythium oligandrum]|eukprot:TMW58142.1 hypothetical protein Poli38472_011730 [Pythium oligandrum]